MCIYNDWFVLVLNIVWGLVLEYEVIKWLLFFLKCSIVFIVVIEFMDLFLRINYVVYGLKFLWVSMLLNNNVLYMWFVVVCCLLMWIVLFFEFGYNSVSLFVYYRIY